MSRHRITLVIDIDDEELEAHLPRAEDIGGPYSRDPKLWDASDVFAAADHGIVDPHECEYDYLEPARQATS